MNSESIQALTATFEGHAQQTETGIEYWLARDLQPLLGYTQWRNVLSIIGKAKTACERSNRQVDDHFAGNRSQGEPPGHSNPTRLLLPIQVAFIHPFGCLS